MFSKEAIKLTRATVEAIKVLAEKAGKKWEWEPKIFDYVLRLKEDIVIGGIWCVLDCYPSKIRVHNKYTIDGDWLPKDDFIPLLRWERIVKILTDLGYNVFVETQLHNCRATISRNGMVIVRKIGEDSQLATVRAVVEIGKGANHNTKKKRERRQII